MVSTYEQTFLANDRHFAPQAEYWWIYLEHLSALCNLIKRFIKGFEKLKDLLWVTGGCAHQTFVSAKQDDTQALARYNTYNSTW